MLKLLAATQDGRTIGLVDGEEPNARLDALLRDSDAVRLPADGVAFQAIVWELSASESPGRVAYVFAPPTPVVSSSNCDRASATASGACFPISVGNISAMPRTEAARYLRASWMPMAI